MKGLFIPEITAEMFRNGCLESIEELMAAGEIYDIDYEPEQRSFSRDQENDSISRKEAIRWIKAECNPYGKPTLDYETSCRIMEHLDRMSSAHPESIQCKDCKHWISGYITDHDDFIPPRCGKYQQMVGHSSDDFCSLAEMREG